MLFETEYNDDDEDDKDLGTEYDDDDEDDKDLGTEWNGYEANLRSKCQCTRKRTPRHLNENIIYC